MKIQFIIAGWHFSYKEFMDELHSLNKDNNQVEVFWSCHKEPSNFVKENFNYGVFFNGGEECGAYDQALEVLDLDDDTIIFFMHDDMIVKNWSFINLCIQKLNEGFKVVGNGRDYDDNFDPYTISKWGITEEFDGAYFKDYVKDKNQHLFDKKMHICKVRPSFICMQYKSVKGIGGFEPRKEAYDSPLIEPDEWQPERVPHYRHNKGIGSFGNLFPALVCYKMNKILDIIILLG